MEAGNQTTTVVDLYSLLKVDRDATDDEIHRAYKALSSTFHPDKLPPTTSPEKREEIQHVFLAFKRANDILMDPVLRLAYRYYGEEGVTLVKRIQQQRREQQTRREASIEIEDDEDEEDDDDEVEANLYERVEKLLATNPIQAREELQRFMEQHDYHQTLTDQNQVQLACSMDFPPVVDLKATFFQGRDYLKYVQKSALPPAGLTREERQYYKQRIHDERGLVDYQINRIRDSQKADVGFTLSSLQPRSVATMTGAPVQPKWSMAMGASTNLVYPGVAEVVKLVGKDEPDQQHPASTFVNCVYQPVPDSQVSLTTNLSNDQSHQFSLGSSRTFSNRSAFRYNMTYLTKSPLDTNIIMNFKSFRHIKDIGMTSGGLSVGADGKILEWNAKWEAVKQTENVHNKCSAKVSASAMHGNSLELAYKLRFQKKHWLDDFITLPRSMEISTVVGSFPKVLGMVTQELTSLAAHPTLGFGMEHDIKLGNWTWVWELTYHGSTFRVPIPVLHLGSISNPGAFYSQKLYYGLYCLALQSMAAEILQDDDSNEQEKGCPQEILTTMANLSNDKTKGDALRQLKMMEPVSERKRYAESQRDGLVILKATYWLEVREVLGAVVGTRVVSMEATNQLQFWVSNGILSLPAIPKSSWLGFYDLHTQGRSSQRSHKWDWRIWRRWTRRSIHPEPAAPNPQLTIRYSHEGYVYEVSAGDTEAMVLPNSKAQLLGHGSLVE